MIDHNKLASIKSQLHADQVQLQGLSAEQRFAAEEHRDLKAAVVSGFFGRMPNGWTPSDEIADLLKLPAQELRDVCADIPTARRAAAERERTHDIQRRLDALTPKVRALSQLVARLDAYVAEHP